MKTEPRDQEFRISQMIYERLLRAYPRGHRVEYGPAMRQLFRDQCREAWNKSQGWGVARLWLRVLPDLVKTSITEHVAAINPGKSMPAKITALFRPLNSPLTGFFMVFTAVFLVVLLMSIAITFILPESYASTTRLKIESDTPPVAGQVSYDPYFIQTTFEIIQSELVLKPVIDKLDLNAKWGKKYFNGETLETSRTMAILKQRIQLAPVKNTRLISITAYSDDKNEAAQVANAIAETYRNYRARSHAELADEGLQVLTDNYQAQELQIKKSQADLEELQKKFGIPDGNEDLKARVLKKQKSYQEMKGQLELLRALNVKQLREVLPAVVADPVLSDLLGKLHDAEQKQTALTNDYLSGNVAVMQGTSLIHELNGEIDDRVKRIMAGMESQVASTQTASDTLSGLVDRSKPTQESKPYWDSKRDLEQLLKSHELLFAKIEAEKLDAQIPKPELVQITDQAEPGRAPVKPNKTLNIVIGAVAGIFIASVAGAVFAFLSYFIGKRMGKTATAT